MLLLHGTPLLPSLCRFSPAPGRRLRAKRIGQQPLDLVLHLGPNPALAPRGPACVGSSSDLQGSHGPPPSDLTGRWVISSPRQPRPGSSQLCPSQPEDGAWGSPSPASLLGWGTGHPGQAQ